MALCMLVGGSVLTSCKDDEAPEVATLQVGRTSVDFPAESSQASITVSGNVQWQASTDSQWITLSASSGNGNGSFEIRVAANTTTASRSGSVTVEGTSGVESKTIAVTQRGMEELLKVSNSEIRLGSQANASGTLTITSNIAWTVTGVDESWLNVSSTSGEGNGTLTLTTRSDNASSVARECELVIKAGSAEAKVKVIQPGLYVPNCQAKPSGMVIISNGVAYEYDCDEKVTYFFRGTYLAEELKKFSDKEIIDDLTSDNKYRETPGGTIYGIYLSPLTEYVICTIAFDKDGHHGDLVKTPFTTKSDKNQAKAEILYLSYDGSQWSWTTVPNATTSRYYMSSMVTEALYDLSDPILAYLFQSLMKNNPDDYPPYVQRQAWTAANESEYFQVLTWAQDADGQFSGMIGRSRRSRNGAPAKSKVHVKKTKRGGIIGERTHLPALMKQIRPVRVK